MPAGRAARWIQRTADGLIGLTYVPIEVLFTLVLFVLGGGYSIVHGGPPEQLAAKVIVIWILVDVSYHLLFGPSGFREVDPAHLVIDGAELAAIVWLALRANRLWPIFAAAAQLITFVGHVVAMIDNGGMSRAYWAITQLPPYIQLFALVCGVASHARRLRRLGPYRSWRLT